MKKNNNDSLPIGQDTSLRHYCRNANNINGDTFVGIKSESIEGKQSIIINFPIGYKISEEEEELREEIINLFNILKDYKDNQSNVSGLSYDNNDIVEEFPIQAYYQVLYYYLNNGYFYTKEERYKKGVSGPINWNRTIKQEKPIVQSNGFIYTQYRVRHHSETDKDLITEINRFCVYQSTLKIGWLFKLQLANKPLKVIDLRLCVNYLKSLIIRTHQDKEKRLYQAMLDILNYENSLIHPKTFHFGTYNFEYIWEYLIEETYGNVVKEDYFPRTKWLLNTYESKINRALEPDSIMREENNIYVIDAKYYRYGITNNPNHLPPSSSINKQITYGEYIATNHKFQQLRDKGMKVYNAFLMPFNSEGRDHSENRGTYYSIGEAISEWKNSTASYERVQGILIDIKDLMNNKVRPSTNEIIKLASEIRKINNNKKHSYSADMPGNKQNLQNNSKLS